MFMCWKSLNQPQLWTRALQWNHQQMGMISSFTDRRNLMKQLDIKGKQHTAKDIKNFKKAHQMTTKKKQFTKSEFPPDHVVHKEFIMPEQPLHPKVLDVAVVGRPNAGKSSLLNRILGVKVSAVSAKYNTTRDRVLGVRTNDNVQISFYDTPGLVDEKERHRFVRSLSTSADESVAVADVTLLVVDAVKKFDAEQTQAIASMLAKSAMANAPIVLVLNKIDLARSKESLEPKVSKLQGMIRQSWTDVKTHQQQELAEKVQEEEDAIEMLEAQAKVNHEKDELDAEEEDDEETENETENEMMDEFSLDLERGLADYFDEYEADEDSGLSSLTCQVGKSCYYISALHNRGIDVLLEDLEKMARPGPWAHHASVRSDQSDLQVVEEVIREKLYRRFHREIPYDLAQENRGWTPFRDGSLRIDQDVIVPHDRLKTMVIGQGGETIRQIGIRARKELAHYFQRNIHLYLNVRSQSS